MRIFESLRIRIVLQLKMTIVTIALPSAILMKKKALKNTPVGIVLAAQLHFLVFILKSLKIPYYNNSEFRGFKTYYILKLGQFYLQNVSIR